MKEKTCRDQFAKLIDVKTFITLVAVAVFAYKEIANAQISEFAMTIIAMVMSFYFGTQQSKLGASKENQKDRWPDNPKLP